MLTPEEHNLLQSELLLSSTDLLRLLLDLNVLSILEKQELLP
jgi:hypothetical protein